MEEEIKLIQLVQSVFNTDKGLELLTLLEDIHCNKPLFRTDANAVFYVIGKSDLVKELRELLTITELPTSHTEEND